MPNNPVVPWKDSRAKRKLTKDILAGRVNPEWKPKQVLAMREELYKPYAKNFGSNLRSLQKSLKKQQDRADEDDAAVIHDLGLYPRSDWDPRGYPRWNGSSAERLLKQDITAGRHEGRKPEALRSTRDEYGAFPDKVFRGHIYQEQGGRRAKSYWLKNKKKQDAVDDVSETSETP